jgi:hypothetical protein
MILIVDHDIAFPLQGGETGTADAAEASFTVDEGSGRFIGKFQDFFQKFRGFGTVNDLPFTDTAFGGKLGKTDDFRISAFVKGSVQCGDLGTAEFDTGDDVFLIPAHEIILSSVKKRHFSKIKMPILLKISVIGVFYQRKANISSPKWSFLWNYCMMCFWITG